MTKNGALECVINVAINFQPNKMISYAVIILCISNSCLIIMPIIQNRCVVEGKEKKRFRDSEIATAD